MPYSTDMRLALVMSLAIVVTMEPDTPALFQTGSIPTLSVMSIEVGGGEVLLEVAVDRTGAVSGIKPLRETATFTERMTQAVRTWRFTPSKTEIPLAKRKPGGPTTEAIDSTVLVAGVFRRPSIIGMTLGAPIKDVAPASNDVPFPSSLVTPPHPPKAMSPGVVLVEVRVDAKGSVSGAKILIPSPGYDDAALSAAQQWRFRPAKPGGTNAPAVAYIVFGFQPPRD